MSARVCGSCGVAGGDKYKCAQCKAFKYCSVACYKRHQAESCKAVSADGSGDTAANSAGVAVVPIAAVPAPSSAVSSTAASIVSAVPKATTERVSEEDLERLASTPSILTALNSVELQNILRRIDGGGTAANSKTGTAAVATDEQRVAALEKYRAANSDFEAFVQEVLTVINKE